MRHHDPPQSKQTLLATFNACTRNAETWVEHMRKVITGTLSWHYEHGIGRLYHEGTAHERRSAQQVIRRHARELHGTVLHIYDPDEPEEYEHGVTPLPDLPLLPDLEASY